MDFFFERPLPDGLFEHQVEGVRWLDTRGSGILAFEQGLGKTVVGSIVIDPPAVIVCPSSIKLNWFRELSRWRPDLSCAVYEPLKPMNWQADVVIVNYEKCKGAVLSQLIARRNVTLIVDEAHLLKDLRVSGNFNIITGAVTHFAVGSNRAQHVWALSRHCDRRILLTGTPMINGRHCELFPLLHLADPGTWRTFPEYAAEFCPPKRGRLGKWDYSENTNPEKLRKLANERFMFRKTKDELKDLPEKFRSSVFVELPPEHAQEYRKVETEFFEWLEEQSGDHLEDEEARKKLIAKMTYLRQIAANGKAQMLANDAVQHIVGGDKPLVIMGHYRKAIYRVGKFIEEYNKKTFGKKIKFGYLTGDQSPADRQESVDAFQGKKIDLLLCNITAAGVGITLTASDTMFFIERSWRPFDNIQAEDRIHRIGQKSTCFIVYYEAVGTIDQHVAQTTQDKFENAGLVIDGSAVSETDSLSAVYGKVSKLFDFGE